MRLVRAHGLGNDYLVLESGDLLDASLVRNLCDRHRGVGGDGVLEPSDPGAADYGVRIWNPDGSVAEKSGNGLRIFARWLRDHRGAADHFSVFTGFDQVTCAVDERGVSVAMGRAVVGAAEVLDVAGVALSIVPVDVGNPHAVVFVDGDPEARPWRSWGRELEVHPRFPLRTNVQIAQVSPDRVALRIWERGAGETLASGSSSCAVAAAAVATGRRAPGRMALTMPGGELLVDVSALLDLVLHGPVEVVGRFEVDPRWISARGR